MTIELIRPEGANINVWNNLLPLFQQSVDLLENSAIEIVSINHKDHFRYINLKHKDVSFHLCVQDLLKIDEIKSFIRHIEKIYEIARSFDTFSDPFHSDIYASVRAGLGESKCGHLAYAAIASHIVNTGKRIWS